MGVPFGMFWEPTLEEYLESIPKRLDPLTLTYKGPPPPKELTATEWLDKRAEITKEREEWDW